MTTHTMQAAMLAALSAAQVAEQDALSIIAANSNKAVIPVITPVETVVHSIKTKRDGSRIVHESDSIEYLDHDAAVEILTGLAKVQHSVSASCASIIADWLQTDSRVSAATASDTKAWKAIKTDCEGSCRPDPLFQFPNQWEQYFSACKKAIALGYPVMNLIGCNDNGIKQVKTRRTLLAFAADNQVKISSSKEERIGKQLDSIADAMYSTESGFDVSSVPINNESKAVIKDLALAHISRNELLESLEYNPDTPEEMIRGLLDDGHADLIRDMLAAFDAAMQPKALKVA